MAPERGLEMRNKYRRIDGLGKKIVRAQLQREDVVQFRRALRHRDDDAGVCGADGMAHFGAVPAWKTEVENDGVRLRREDAIDCSIAASLVRGVETVRAQMRQQRAGELLVVFDDKDGRTFPIRLRADVFPLRVFLLLLVVCVTGFSPFLSEFFPCE